MTPSDPTRVSLTPCDPTRSDPTCVRLESLTYEAAMSPSIPTLARRSRHHQASERITSRRHRRPRWDHRIVLSFEWLEDRTVLSTFTVTSIADAGPGSLRQAILDSNAATGGTNTIDFQIPGQGVQVIAPASPLPAITGAVLIDGRSQPGFAGTPLIELDGSQAGTADGLTITGPDVTVRGLDIGGFSQGAGIHITGTGATSDWIYGDFLGTDPTGTQARPNDEGVEIDSGASDNTIGGIGAAARDVIGNGWDSVHIIDAGTTGNVVQGGFIGITADGSHPLGNGASGVAVFAGATGNTIGGTASGSGDVISGNAIYGVYISDPGTAANVVEGDDIGTDFTGTFRLGNGNSGVSNT